MSRSSRKNKDGTRPELSQEEYPSSSPGAFVSNASHRQKVQKSSNSLPDSGLGEPENFPRDHLPSLDYHASLEKMRPMNKGPGQLASWKQHGAELAHATSLDNYRQDPSARTSAAGHQHAPPLVAYGLDVPGAYPVMGPDYVPDQDSLPTDRIDSRVVEDINSSQPSGSPEDSLQNALVRRISSVKEITRSKWFYIGLAVVVLLLVAISVGVGVGVAVGNNTKSKDPPTPSQPLAPTAVPTSSPNPTIQGNEWMQVGQDLDGTTGDQFGFVASLSGDGTTVAVAGAVPLIRLWQSGQSASPFRGKKDLSKTRWTKSTINNNLFLFDFMHTASTIMPPIFSKPLLLDNGEGGYQLQNLRESLEVWRNDQDILSTRFAQVVEKQEELRGKLNSGSLRRLDDHEWDQHMRLHLCILSSGKRGIARVDAGARKARLIIELLHRAAGSYGSLNIIQRIFSFAFFPSHYQVDLSYHLFSAPKVFIVEDDTTTMCVVDKQEQKFANCDEADDDDHAEVQFTSSSFIDRAPLRCITNTTYRYERMIRCSSSAQFITQQQEKKKIGTAVDHDTETTKNKPADRFFKCPTTHSIQFHSSCERFYENKIFWSFTA